MNKSICIVQTGLGSSKELMDLCSKIMPEVKVYQIIDDSMLPEMLAEGEATKDVKRRLFHYYEQAASLGAEAILHQCVVAGDVALKLREFIDIPIVRIDEGMLRKALTYGKNIAVLATAPPAMKQSIAFLEQLAEESGKEITVQEMIVTKQTVHESCQKAQKENDVIILAQPSMTALLPLLTDIEVPVLTAPESGIRYLKKMLKI